MEHQWTWMLSALLVASGCDDSKPPHAAAASGATSASKAPDHGWRAGDEKLDPKAMLAIGTQGETAERVTLSTAPLDCDTLRVGYPDAPPVARARRLDVWLVRPTEPGGSPGPWSVDSAYASDRRGRRLLTTQAAQLDGVSVSGGKVTVRGLELAFGDELARHQVMWNGDLSAVDCGRAPRREPGHAQDGFALTVAGEKVVVGGASLRPQRERTLLRLTRAPHDCSSSFSEGYDFYLDLAFEGAPPKLRLGSLQGPLFPGFPSASVESGKVRVTADDSADGGSEVRMTLDGTLDLRGYAVTLAGAVAAARCP